MIRWWARYEVTITAGDGSESTTFRFTERASVRWALGFAAVLKVKAVARDRWTGKRFSA